MNAPPFNGLIIRPSAGVARGTQALARNGTVLLVVSLDAPIEDAAGDTILMHPEDYASLMVRMPRDEAGE